MILLRLFLAALVVISHSAEMLGLPEPLRAIGSPVSFGYVAVEGFFLISGYLVSQSWERDPSAYFGKRIKRIYPAFIVCSLLCVFVVAPIGGADLGALGIRDWGQLMARTLLLKPVELSAFNDHAFATLDGSMWTICYEFRCYILAALLGLCGLYRKPRTLLGLGLILCAGGAFSIPMPHWFEGAFGVLQSDFRLTGIFIIGAALRLLTRWKPGPNLLKTDISYGLYLYAWPVGQLLISAGVREPWSLGVLTLVLASGCGWVSWMLVENPALRQPLLSPPEAA